MSNGDEAMSPEEFAKLMGAYPEPSGNPLPTYGGYMDNSAANFAWVNNTDYFGAEDSELADLTDDDLSYIAYQYHHGGKPSSEMPEGDKVGDVENALFNTDWFSTRSTKYGLAFIDRAHDNAFHVVDDLGEIDEPVTPKMLQDELDSALNMDDIERYGYEGDAETDLTPTNQMNNSIGQVVPITNPMELPTNLIEVEAGGGPEGQITPDVFSADYETPWDVPLDKYEEVFGMTNEEILEKFPDLEVDDYKRCLMAMRKNAETFEATQVGYEGSPVPGMGMETDDNPDVQWVTDPHDPDQHTIAVPLDWVNPNAPPPPDPHGEQGAHGGGGTGVHGAETFEASPKWECDDCGEMHDDEGDAESCCVIDCEHHDSYMEGYGTAERGSSIQFVCNECDAYGDGTLGRIDWEHSDKELATTQTAETFEAPYGGLGAIMDIGKSTPLADFTDEELTTSSAIHGDFDQASLNYSGHQNIEVKAEMDIVADGMAVVSNVRDDVVGVVEVIDDEDDDEMVEISIQDENMEEIGSFTLDDGQIMDDYDDYLAESKLPSVWSLGLGAVAAILAFPYLKEGVSKVFSADNDIQEVLENDPEVIENPDTGDLDPAAYEELVVESTGYAVDVIPMGLDGSFMGSRFAALPTERYVDYNDPGIGAHIDAALNRDELFLEPEMAMVQAAEGDKVVKETQAPGQSPYFQMGQEPADMNYRVIKETHPISLDPAVKPFIPQSMTGYTGNANTPPSVMNKMFNIGVLGQTPLFVPGQSDMGANHFGSRDAQPDMLGLGGSVGGPLSDQVNLSYTDGTTSMSLAQWAIENTVSQSSDTEAVVIDRSSGAMKRIRRV